MNAERISTITVNGAEFVVEWDEELHDEADYQFGHLPAERDCWVTRVKIDGVWFGREIFHDWFAGRLDSALRALEEA